MMTAVRQDMIIGEAYELVADLLLHLHSITDECERCLKSVIASVGQEITAHQLSVQTQLLSAIACSQNLATSNKLYMAERVLRGEDVSDLMQRFRGDLVVAGSYVEVTGNLPYLIRLRDQFLAVSKEDDELKARQLIRNVIREMEQLVLDAEMYDRMMA